MVITISEMKSLKERRKRTRAHYEPIKCERCNYIWKPKVRNPVACPRCKARLDIDYIRELKEIPKTE